MKLRDFLPCFPAVICTVPEAEREAVGFAMQRGFAVRCRRKGARLFISVSGRSSAELLRQLADCGYSAELRRSRILPYLKRPGIPVGFFLFVLILYLLSGVVWRVEISGAEKLDEIWLREQLSAVGVCEGAARRSIDNDRVRILMMRRTEQIAWMSVVLDGTIARVQIVETEPKPPADTENRFSHIRAARDGMISRIETVRGQDMVRVGDTVRAGELLVSGIVEERDGDIGLYNAVSKVYAMTNREETVRVAYEEQLIKPGTPRLCGLELSFFGFSVKIPLRYGLDEENCVIMTRKDTLDVFPGFSTPVIALSRYAISQTAETVCLTREEAVDRARTEAFSRLLASIDGSVVTRRTTVTEDEKGVTVTVTALCEENIAQSIPFTAEQ
ncbi:MAG: sporulation protein YqfD [Eubacteriales bacterium]